MYEIFLVLCNEHKSVPQSNIVHALLSKIPFLVYFKKKKIKEMVWLLFYFLMILTIDINIDE